MAAGDGRVPEEGDIDAARRLVEAAFKNQDDAFTSMHELFLNLMGGGFTEAQALWLIGYMFVGNGRPDSGEADVSI